MSSRTPCLARAAVLTAAVGALALTTTSPTAGASTTPKDLCIPAAWYTVTSVITRDGIVQLLPTTVEPNNTANPSTLTQTVTVNGEVDAGVQGNIPVAPAGVAASIGPSVSAKVSGTVTVTGTITVPPGQTGYLRFGIITEKTNGTAYSRDVFCNVTSAPEVATAPEGFGYLASTAATNPTAVITGR
jgi:hypothetical protein